MQAGNATESQYASNSESDLDIRGDFEEALSTKLDFVGAYSFNKTFPNVPNPSLQIGGLGTVGVPLSTREAEVIKSHAEQAPFGMGERTVIDRNIAFANPEWAIFLEDTVREVCNVLGVNYGANHPQCELYKLLLYEVGSHFLPHVDTEKKDGMFATIIVVLPSEFTGGEAHLSHGGFDTVYDCSATSLNATTVMAWYTDVMHEIKPIKSGYRLALSYNLIHTTNSLRPALSTNSAFVEEVTCVLNSWSRSTGSGIPEKLVYLLDHRYSLANLRGSALKGVDDIKGALLQQIAQRVGFSLGMATVVCCLSGAANDSGRSRYDHFNKDDLDFEEIEDRMLSIQDFVDLDGVKISHSLMIDEDGGETIPEDLADVIEDGNHDGQEYEGYLGNGAGCLSRFSRRTALIIWPNRNNFEVAYGGDGLKYACMRLESDAANSLGPSEDALKLVTFVLMRAGDSPTLVIPAVCCAAISWKDYTLWNNTSRKFFWNKDQPLLGDSDLSNALCTFGFGSTRETLKRALRTSPNNSSRIQLLSIIESALGRDKEIEKSASSWLSQERVDTLKNLKKPNKDDAELIVSSSLTYGGANFLAECIVPQFIEQADSASLFVFADAIFRSLDDEPALKTALVSKSITVAVSKTDFFKLKPATIPTYLRQAPKVNDPNLETFKECLQHCSAVQCPEAITLVLEKAKQTDGLSALAMQARAKKVMLPLLSFVAELRSKNPSTFPLLAVKALAQTAITTFLGSVDATGRDITVPVVRSLVKAASVEGGAEMIATSIMPRMLASEIAVGVQLALAEEIHTNASSLSVNSEYHGPNAQSMVTTLANKFADGVELSTSEVISGALHRCMKLEASEACAKIVQRLISTSREATPNILETILIPVIPALRGLFTLSHPPLTGVINTLFQVVSTRWVTVVLGQKPAQDPSAFTFLARWDCTCSDCQRVKNFLRQPSLERLSLSLDYIGARPRKHIETYLHKYATSVTTYSTIRTSPQGLQIDFKDIIKLPLLWEASQKKGLQMLRSISTDENELERILGACYQTMLQALGVGRVNETGRPIPSGRVESNATAHPGPSCAGPSAKKRKREPSPADIIDLT